MLSGAGAKFELLQIHGNTKFDVLDNHKYLLLMVKCNLEPSRFKSFTHTSPFSFNLAFTNSWACVTNDTVNMTTYLNADIKAMTNLKLS